MKRMYRYKPPRRRYNFPNMWEKSYSRPVFSLAEKKEYENILFPSHPDITEDLLEDPVLGEQVRNVKKKIQRMTDSGASVKSVTREIKKEWNILTKALIRKYPKDKLKIERLQRKQVKEYDIKLRIRELLEIGSRRQYTKKEEQELSRLLETLNKIEYNESW